MVLIHATFLFTKEDITNLDESINKWREIAQKALLELKELTNLPKIEEQKIIMQMLNDLKVCFKIKSIIIFTNSYLD